MEKINTSITVGITGKKNWEMELVITYIGSRQRPWHAAYGDMNTHEWYLVVYESDFDSMIKALNEKLKDECSFNGGFYHLEYDRLKAIKNKNLPIYYL